MPPVSRRSSGPSSEAARVRSNSAKAWMLVGARVVERVSDRRFGPEQEPRRRRRRAGQGGEAARGHLRRSRAVHLSCWPMLG